VAVPMVNGSPSRVSVAPDGKIYVLTQLSWSWEVPPQATQFTEIDPVTLAISRSWAGPAGQPRSLLATAGHLYGLLNDPNQTFIADLDLTAETTVQHSLGNGCCVMSLDRGADGSIYATVGSDYQGFWRIHRLFGGVVSTFAQGSESITSSALSPMANKMLLGISAYPSTSTKAVDLTTGAVTTFSTYGGSLTVGVLGSTPPPPPPPTLCTDPNATNNGGALPCTYPPPPPTTCTDPAATNNGGALPCTYPPPPPPPPTTCTDPNATNNGGALPCTYPAGGPSDVVVITTNTWEYVAPNYQQNSTHRLFDAITGTFLAEAQPAATNTSATIVRAGKIFSVTEQGSVRVFDGTTHQSLGDTATGIYPQGVDASPAGDRVYVVSGNGSLKVVDVASQTVVATVAVPMVNGSPSRVSVAPDGKIYVLTQLSWSWEVPPQATQFTEIDPVTLAVSRTWAGPVGQPRALVATAGHVYGLLNDPSSTYIADLDLTSGTTVQSSLGNGCCVMSLDRGTDGSVYATLGDWNFWRIHRLFGGVVSTVAQGTEGLQSSALSPMANKMLLSNNGYPTAQTIAVDLTSGVVTNFANYTGSVTVGRLP
jgi:hypothetical protein